MTLSFKCSEHKENKQRLLERLSCPIINEILASTRADENYSSKQMQLSYVAAMLFKSECLAGILGIGHNVKCGKRVYHFATEI